jgi:hypothetical protein
MFWLKWIKNGSLVQAWDMLADVGSPSSGKPHPAIEGSPTDAGPNYLQVELTVQPINVTLLGANCKTRVQICPRGTSGLPPCPIPPCGSLVDSSDYVYIPPYIYLFPPSPTLVPIWTLPMWTENIDLHLEIIDVDQIPPEVLNCIVPYFDNSGWRADDLYVPIDVKGGGGTVSITVHVEDATSKAPLSGANVSVT